MDFGRSINLAWRIVKLEKPAAQEAADDREGLLPTLIVMAIGGALGAAGGSFFNPVVVGAGIVLGPLFSAIFIGIYHLIALAFGGKATYLQYLQSAGLGTGLVSWVGVIPFVGGLIQLWGIPVAVVATEQVHGLDRTKAVMVVLIPVVLLLLFCCAASIFFGSAILKFLQTQNQMGF